MTRRWLRRACALLCAAVASAAAAQAPAPAAAGDAADAQHEILVMLHLPPPHFRPDAGYAGRYGDGAGRASRLALARRLAAEHGLSVVSDWPMPLLGVDCYVMAVPEERSAAAEADAVAGDPRVRWAQPMHVYRTQGEPATHRDPLYAAQPAAAAWHLAELHRAATGAGVRVAVIDSGVDTRHPDLDGAVAEAQNFVDGQAYAAERHGTAVAGIIAARADNGIGVAGVAPASEVVALRACWQDAAAGATLCTSLSLAKALHAAIGDAVPVINLSLGGPEDRLLAQLLDVALAHGLIVVAAFDARHPDGGFPASHAGVIGVADDAPPAPGHGAVLLAPGHDVPTTVPGGYAVVSGASYAAAHVAGLLALLRERAPGAVRGMAALAVQGGGVIDACGSLARAGGGAVCRADLAGAAPPAVQP